MGKLFLVGMLAGFSLWFGWLSESLGGLEKTRVEPGMVHVADTPGDAPHRTVTAYQDGEQVELPGTKDSNGDVYEINAKDLPAVISCGFVSTSEGRTSCVRYYVSPWHHHRQKQDDVDIEL